MKGFKNDVAETPRIAKKNQERANAKVLIKPTKYEYFKKKKNQPTLANSQYALNYKCSNITGDV